MLKSEILPTKLPENIVCPGCNAEIELSDEERTTGKIHCPECEAFIDFSFDPPWVINKANYVELLYSLNQGDIAVIKSILDSGNIDYYTSGENFLSIDPLIQPAKFFVNANQLDDTKEMLKDFKLNIWGASTNQ